MEPDLSNLNPEQKAAVTHPGGPALIISGPGSGKTRVLAHRIAYLINEKGISPENILAVTFTNKAAGEMRARVEKLLRSSVLRAQSSSIPWLGTFHSLCARILRREASPLGLSPNLNIYDEGDSLTAIKQALKNLNIPADKFSPKSVAFVIGNAKNELLDAAGFAKFAQGYFQEQATRVFSEYEKILRKNDALDFDDLILVTVRALEKSPILLKKYQAQFQEILIDEYQDTNQAQYIFGKILAKTHREIFVVGDMAQAIYSFRGADFRNLLNFEKDYPQAKIYNLAQNYRSTKTIIEAASGLIKHNLNHIPLELWTANEDGEKIMIVESQNETEEAEFLAGKVRELQQVRGFSLNEFAILYRTNAQSRPVEEVFLKASLPYILIGGTKFYERKEIKDVIAHLRLLQSPADSVSRERLGKIGKRKMNDYLLWLEKTRQDQPDFAESLSTRELLDMVLRVTSYLLSLNDGTEEGLARIENVKELRSVAEEFPSLPNFLENVTLIQQETLPNGHLFRKADNTLERVTLMTLHAAKGLEFAVIFIIGLEEGLFPHSRSLMARDELEEERRLCYVGLTRAKKLLYLTFAKRRLYFGLHQANMPSRFLGEIPAGLTRFDANLNLKETEVVLD